MAAILKLASTDDAAEIVEALLIAADARAGSVMELRWRDLAHTIGDALDHLPTPTTQEHP